MKARYQFAIAATAVLLCCWLPFTSGCQKIVGTTGSTEKSAAEITGFFGLKLGERLPDGCPIISTNINAATPPSYGIIPPQTNSNFDIYSVSLDTNGVVIDIEAIHNADLDDYNKEQPMRDALKSALEKSFGYPGYSEHQSYSWSKSGRAIFLNYSMQNMIFLSCCDQNAMDVQRAAWKQAQLESFDANGISTTKGK